jgi:hypothetical protein
LVHGEALRITFFHFDREETGEKALRGKIEALLQRTNLQQLQQGYRILKALLEP